MTDKVDRHSEISSIVQTLRRKLEDLELGGVFLEPFDDTEILRTLGLEHGPDDSMNVHYEIFSDDAKPRVIGDVYYKLREQDGNVVADLNQLKIRPLEFRGRGLGSRITCSMEDWLRSAGVAYVFKRAEADGSLFAATHGFDFDLPKYRRYMEDDDHSETGLRWKAVELMSAHHPILETSEFLNPPPRESVTAMFRRLSALGGQDASLIEEFRHELGLSSDNEQAVLISPQAIAEFRSENRLKSLDGEPIGRAFLARTAWNAVKRI